MTRTEHLLILLMEECAEVQQRASKALRFGLGEVQEGQPLDNRERLSVELADVMAIVQMLVHNQDLGPAAWGFGQVEAKIAKVERWMTYSATCVGGGR